MLEEYLLGSVLAGLDQYLHLIEELNLFIVFEGWVKQLLKSNTIVLVRWWEHSLVEDLLEAQQQQLSKI